MTAEITRNDYHGKYLIADLYRTAIVAPIIARQELKIAPEDIYILLDDRLEGGEDVAKIAKMPEMLQAVIYQYTGKLYPLLLKLSQAAMKSLEPDAITYFIYDALRHIILDEDSGEYAIQREHDIEIWAEVLPFIAEKRAVPNLSLNAVFAPDEVGESANSAADDE